MDIGANLDLAMKRAGFHTQTALAEHSAVSQSMISRILKNQGSIDALALHKLAHSCKVTMDYLMTGDSQSEEDIKILSYIDLREARLITLFRECNEESKVLILLAAEEALRSQP